MFRFTIPNLRIRHKAGRITVERPAPPAPPRPETLADLTARRSELTDKLARSVRGDSMIFGTAGSIKDDLAKVDSQIAALLEPVA